jgi:response regulator RpfG family c-di-GMP phosphodiesterase
VTSMTRKFLPPSKRESLPKVLLVDDEVAVLDGLRRQLHGKFLISTAESGQAALQLMEAAPTFAVVVSDMRMPSMDGATFLAHVRSNAPDTVRMLLTGQADTDSAIAAINDGQIFRFLTKPCAPDTLQSALRDAVALHRLTTAEKELLEQTLRGAVKALIDTLSLAHPKAYSRAVRIARTVSELTEAMNVQDPWEVEVAAMLAQLAAVSLPPGVLDKLDTGRPLNEDEQDMVNRVPSVSEQLIATIPRLEGVAKAIGMQQARYDAANAKPGSPAGKEIPLAARMLHVATDFDMLTSGRVPAVTAIAQLRKKPGVYDPEVLDVLAKCYTPDDEAGGSVEVNLDDLQPGMVLLEDLINGRGIVLLGRGTAVTAVTLQRLRNHLAQDGVSGAIVVARGLRR